jgi:hypothetical protein
MSSVVLAYGLVAVVSSGSGCQAVQSIENFKQNTLSMFDRVSTPPFRHGPARDQQYFYETSPGDVSGSAPGSPQLALPPEPVYSPAPGVEEPSLTIPPAPEAEVPQVRRWAPTRPSATSHHADQFNGYSSTSAANAELPSARVTYNSEEPTTLPVMTVAPEQNTFQNVNSQPRLFRPTGPVQNLFDNLRRKLSRGE